jgi:hypothetical protein
LTGIEEEGIVKHTEESFGKEEVIHPKAYIDFAVADQVYTPKRR